MKHVSIIGHTEYLNMDKLLNVVKQLWQLLTKYNTALVMSAVVNSDASTASFCKYVHTISTLSMFTTLHKYSGQ